MVPKKAFLTNGVGRHEDRLTSFELALRDASIEKYNLVTVSSILPPGCKIIPKDEGLKYLNPGEIVHCVLARTDTNEHNRLAAASIGIAIPADDSQYGYLSEHHPYGQTDEVAGAYAEKVAANMLATTLGLEPDPEKIEKAIKTRNITQSAEGKTGLWTTVIAAAVLLNGLEEKMGNQ